MHKSFIQNLAKLSSLSVILVLLFYYLVVMVSATGSHVTNHGIESDDDDMKPDETSLSVSAGKRLEPLHSSTEYRLVTASQELEMELGAGNYNKSKTWLLWSQQQQPFQLCLACKCCMSAAEPSKCTSLPCCFVIDCQLPNKPYGVCAFVPKTCNCTSCATPLL
ncbi:uncharacterized protein LOC129881553 isoform X2 [Solanum dulcamara]|uniref:uncharacterized protein LOC129881553 isoform X2 n=1 Tax=Solanum dulcamara TaxID=45834 RepID=UPI0024867940|nr:uncharacterized protein LOC129881553 isoform X2 [Solanum dulcamara]